MKRPWWRGPVLFVCIALVGVTSLAAQTAPPIVGTPANSQPLDPLALGWPRSFSTNGYEFAIYQPQVSQWPGNQIEGRFAAAVRPTGTSNETYGLAFFTARTEIDKVNRLVTLENFMVSKVDFPTEKTNQNTYQAILQSELPKTAHTIPFDHLEAVFVLSGEIAKSALHPVNDAPPRIIYTMVPSLLILVDGPPVLRPLVPNYECVVNTHALLLLNTNFFEQGYFVYAATNWYSAPSLDGPWILDTTPPADIAPAFDAVLATRQVDLMPPKSALAASLNIYVSTTPAELIQSQGVPVMDSIAGTDLLYVSNSDNAIFFCMTDANYYVLISGRWFKCPSLYGPWSFVEPTHLPAGFAKIPPQGPKAGVLASVPGTPMAREALIANSIPQTATLTCSEARLRVNYSGSPGFAPIVGTTLSYATNSSTPVIQVNPDSFYACEAGVWFSSSSDTGPWAVATSVPPVIYTIPVDCPIHYVTYAYVYGSTATSVYVGYTPGYLGTVATPTGVVVYGTGWNYPPVIVGGTYFAYPPTYGYGWSMTVSADSGFAFGYCAGASYACWAEPYWGGYAYAYPYGYSYTHVNCNAASLYTCWGTAVHATGYYGQNPYTGTRWGAQSATTFNPYTGTSGALNRGAAYNPYTGGYAAGHSGTWYNPYSGSTASARAGVEGNAYSGNYAAGRQAAGYNPNTGTYGATSQGVTGNAYSGSASAYNRGVVGNTSTGNAIAWSNGNIYTDKDGNVARYNPSTGGYDRYSSTGWQSASVAGSSSWADRGWNTSSWNNWGGSSDNFDRESWGQAVGNQRFDSWRRSGGGGWGGFRGGGFRR